MKPEYIVTETRNQLGVDIGIDVSEYEDCTVVCFYKKDAEEVIAALEKQIAKKPERLNAFRSIGKCGGCERVISTRTASVYCQYCGNKVDWGSEDET